MIRLFLLLLCFLANLALATDHSNFVKAIENKDWNKAKAANSELSTLVTWLELTSEPKPSFYKLKNFLNQYPHWPRAEELKRKIEENNFKDCKNSDVLQWFNAHPPKTIPGKKKYLSLLSDGELKTKYIKEVWKEAAFTKEEQDNFLKSYGAAVSEHDYKIRLDYLLFNKKIDQANRLLDRAQKDLIPLYKARIAIQQGDLKALQQYKNSSNNIGILYDIASVYNKNKDEDNLVKILKISSKINSSYQHYFWSMKAKMIRTLIQEQDYKTAYLFASSHGDLGKAEYSEAEWLAGWISLRFLNKPEQALIHFTNMYHKVKRPMSVSRAGYWLARSYEALKDDINSKIWYENAAKYYTSFYGQLAVCKTNNCEVNIPNDPEIKDTDIKNFNNNNLVKSARILHKTKRYSHLVQEFLLHAVDNSKQLGEIALITRLGFDMNHHHLSVEAAKHATYKDVYIIHSNYPILKSVYKEHELDPALVMALIRQESVFNHKAVSCAGAMGLMQMMPHVAKETAQNLKVAYKKDKLSDPHYNTHLGTTHLDKLVTCYEPSYILSIAAYNAGDKAVQKWLDKNGDPRMMNDVEDIVDWIERISFYETRNYVQRVLEGKSIYHLLMTKTTKLPLLSDLTEGSGKNCTEAIAK